MLDYVSLEASTEFPAFITIFYTVLLAFVLSCIVSFTHYWTHREIVVPIEFLQSLILVSIVSATVMHAIGDSLARGLGMLGALAIIRYRTTLKTPRNMVFTFAALAAGIACGVYAYVIALTGTIGFCIIAFAMRYSPLSKPTALMGNLKFQQPIMQDISLIENVIAQHCKNFRKVKFQLGKSKKQVEGLPQNNDEFLSFDYEVSFIDLDMCKSLHQALSNMEAISQLRLTFENVNENV